jgi:hypothetical protein
MQTPYTHSIFQIISNHDLPLFQKTVGAVLDKLEEEKRNPSQTYCASVVPMPTPEGALVMMNVASCIIEYECTEEEHKQWIFGNKLGIVKP